MKILVTGSRGLIGSHLVPYLREQGHEVWRLIRKGTVATETAIVREEDSPARFEGFDTVIHLAGESIAGKRWHQKQKKRIRESRVSGTARLVQMLTGLSSPPSTLICASAVGFYSTAAQTVVDEEASAGSGFLASVVADWEKAANQAAEKGMRVINLRLGMVLAGSGGALAKMRFPFKFGLGAFLGHGKQPMPWVHITDVLLIIAFLIDRTDISGPVNLVAPGMVDNRTFSKTLGQILARPVFLSVPGLLLRLIFGEMADTLLLKGARVQPQKLTRAGYNFRYPELRAALNDILKNES